LKLFPQNSHIRLRAIPSRAHPSDAEARSFAGLYLCKIHAPNSGVARARLGGLVRCKTGLLDAASRFTAIGKRIATGQREIV